MEFRVLGPVAMRASDHWHVPQGRLQRTLLASLLIRPGEVVPAGELIDVLWGSAADPEAAARLQVHVHRLRQTLEDPSLLQGARGGYALRASPQEIDAPRFEELANKALVPDTDPATVLELTDAALALWHGRPYEGVSAPPCEAEADRLEGRRIAVLEARFGAVIDLGRHREVLDALDALSQRHLLNEDLQVLLMTALDRAGRRSEALSVFRRTRGHLVEELGVEPGHRLQELHEQILLGESSGTRGPATPVPQQLPPSPRLMEGRDDALDQLDLLMTADGPSVAVLVGTAGVGKTSLALAWAHLQRARYPDGHLHSDLRGFGGDPPVAASDVLDSFIRALGASSVPSTIEEKAALYRSHIAGRRMLIVLDNASTEEQVRPLLPATPGCDVLVTSRISLAGLAVREDAHLMGLAPLDQEAATRLIADALGHRLHKEPTATAALISHCAGLPLALRIVAEQLRAKPTVSVAAFVAGITDAAAPLDRFDLGEASTSVRAVLGWSYDSLPEAPRRVLRCLGIHPGRRPDVAAISAMTRLDSSTVAATLDLLDRANLIEEGPPGHHHQHDLLRSFCAERARLEESQPELEGMRTRLLAHYVAAAVVAGQLIRPQPQDWPEHVFDTAARAEAPTLTSRAEARAWFSTRQDDLIACASAHDAEPTVEGDRLVRDLARVSGHYLLDSGAIAVAVPLLLAWRHAAERAADIEDECRAMILLGSAKRDAGDSLGSESDIRNGIQRALEHGAEDVAARGMLNLGVVILSESRAGEAHELYRTALEIDERLGLDAHSDLVRSNLGTTLVLLGRLDEAIEVSEQVRATSHAINNSYLEAFCIQLIGEALLRKGELDDAAEHANAAHHLAHSIGARAREADIVNLLGQIQMARGHHEAALEEFRAGLRLSREVESIPIVLDMLEGCADALLAMGSPEALSYLHEARSIARSMADPVLEAELLQRLATSGAKIDR